MEELKAKGNAAFASKNFEEAIRFYDQAIAVDQKNIDLYNNRSAASFELKRYEDAIEDAKKSNKISSNSKAHMRMGNAYWAMGRLELAKDSYELALVLAPSNQTVRDNLNRVRQIIAATNGTSNQQGAFPGEAPGNGGGAGQGSGDLTSLYLDLAVVILGVTHFVTMFFAAGVSMLCWRLLLATFAVRQAIILRAAGLLQPNLAALKQWLTHFSGQYLVLCGVAAAVAVPPLHLLLASIVLYCIVDLSANHTRLRGLVPPALYDRALPHLQKAKASRDVLIGNAATCEAMLTFMLFFASTSMIFSILYIQFIKYRYRADPFSRLAFTALRQTVERLTRHRLCPPMIDNLFGKLCDLLYRVGTG